MERFLKADTKTTIEFPFVQIKREIHIQNTLVFSPFALQLIE